MKNFLVFLFLIFFNSICTQNFGQITYHKYFDCSNEWRYKIEGFGLVGNDFRAYTTRYFDGDTSINGIGYYRLKEVKRKINSNLIETKFLLFLREDSNGNIITQSGDTLFQFKKLEQLNTLDQLTSQNSLSYIYGLGYNDNCTVFAKDTLSFAGKSIFAIYGSDTTNNKKAVPLCIVEGIGGVYPDLCNLGCCDREEYLLYFFNKNNNQIDFVKNPIVGLYDSFPLPQRTVSCILSVPKIDLKVTLHQSKVLLKWTNSEEKNVVIYNIQKSYNGKSFYNIGFVNSFNNDYYFIDELKIINQNVKPIFYRLEIIDANGSKYYSELRQVNSENKNIYIKIFPNPSNNNINILSNDVQVISIYNHLGQIVFQSMPNNNVTNINVSHFAKGIYFTKLLMKTGELICEKLIIQ